MCTSLQSSGQFTSCFLRWWKGRGSGTFSRTLNYTKKSAPTLLVQLKDPSPPSHVDFLRETYQRKTSRPSAGMLVQAIRKSSRREYQTVWKAFTEFLRSLKLDRMSDEIVLCFMRDLFERKRFSPATVSTYKSTLSKILLWAFDLDLAKPFFRTSIRAFSTSSPPDRILPLNGVWKRSCSCSPRRNSQGARP